MSTVAHCTALYLHIAGSWIHAQIAGLQRYRAVVLAQETANLAQFPVPRVYSATDRSPAVRLVNRVLRRLTGQYPFYGGILRRERAALIHAHFGYEGARCLAARRASGLPLITSFYGADATQYARRPAWQRRYRRLFSEGEWFLVEGSTMRAQLAAIGCPPERIKIHHLGVDLARIPFRERQGEDRVRFLICAGLKEKKGIPYALRALAAALVARPFAFELVIVGDGPDRSALEALVGELGLGDHTRFRGMLSYDQVLVELDRADLLLQTSVVAADGDTEGGAPVILLDAQAAGLPVVATRHADIPEYVVDGEGGLLAAERDVDGLAACIRQLIEHPERWAAMGRAGRRHVATQYDAATQAGRLEDLYDEFIAARVSVGNPAASGRARAAPGC